MECPVCLEVLDSPFVTTSCCGNKFHIHCLSKCSTCSLCRRNIGTPEPPKETVIVIREVEQPRSPCHYVAPIMILTIIVTFSIFGAMNT